MSYLAGNIHTDIRADLLTPNGVVSNNWQLTGPSSLNTDITVGTSTITLYSGSSYYLEANVSARNANRNGYIIWQFHDGAGYVGQEGMHGLGGASVYRKGRGVARALILDSDITVSLSLTLRLKTVTGSGWQYAWTDPPWSFNWSGYPSIQVWQLPT